MKKNNVVLILLVALCSTLTAVVPTPVPGESLWCITARLIPDINFIQSKICQIKIDESLRDYLIGSKLDIAISQAEILVSLLDPVISIFDTAINIVNTMDVNIIATVSRINSIESKIDNKIVCNSTEIKGPTTITTSGVYCLEVSVNGSIAIQQSNVVLNLNKHEVSQGITVASGLNTITIRDGIVRNTSSADAIMINAGATNITISDVMVANARRGIFCDSMVGGLIERCSLVSNVTGIEIAHSYGVSLYETIARNNTQSGFSFIATSSSVVTSCQALSTGRGNANVLNNNVYGFIAQQSSNNIFENCIANATQALSTTDYNSIVAGFALTGTSNCNKIIGCEAANAITNASGVTVPYGIYLQNALSNFLTLTAVPAIPTPAANVLMVDWSPDGQYFVVGTQESTPQVRVYYFDRINFVVSQVATPNIAPASPVQAVKWSPNGRFIAAGSFFAGGTDTRFRVYEFDALNNTLTLFAVPDVIPNGVARISWSPDMQFIACGSSNDPEVKVYRFDPVNATLIQVVSNSVDLTVGVLDLEWSPDGEYLAVGTAAGTNPLRIYRFERGTEQLTQVLAFAPNSTIAARGVSWSSDGQYLAIVMGSTDTPKLRVYSFNRATNQLTLLTTTGSLGLSGNGQSVSWSSDDRYLAVGFASVPRLSVFSFNRGTNQLISISTPNIAPGNTVNWAQWSPDGRYIAGVMNNTAVTIALYEAFSFPYDNVIKDNVVYCNSGAQFPSGVGINGSSICNMIIQNTSYSNPINTSIVSSNYQFVCNVFNQLFNNSPTLLQNIALGSCEPIAIPDNELLLAKQLKVDVIGLESRLAQLSASLNNAALVTVGCGGTSISTPTTIGTSGSYCLANEIAGSITINASDVVLDLSDRRVTQGISIGSGVNRVKIQNGIVENSSSADAISVASGVSNITIAHVSVKNAQRGIVLTGVRGGLVSNCSMIRNVTGIELIGSRDITIQESIARANQKSGFSLVSSGTNCIIDCKAINTGLGNRDVINNNVYGFISDNGYCNVFERCIANATQALSTTDYNSIVAGFALMSTESCSKIIECEAANAITNASGVTVPYGIYLHAVPRLNLFVNRQTGGAIVGCAWSPDGQYLAVIGTGGHDLLLYKFDRVMNTLILIDSKLLNIAVTDFAQGITWSPDGRYLIIGFRNTSLQARVILYDFVELRDTLVQVFSLNLSNTTGIVRDISWSADGLYITLAFMNGATPQVLIYKFDNITQTLTLAYTQNTSGVNIHASRWSPNGYYLAVEVQVGSATTLILYYFNVATQTLTLLDSKTFSNATPFALAWSPDGQYIALGMRSSTVDTVALYRFNTVTNTLQFAASVNPLGGTGHDDYVLGLSWSPDSRYIAIFGIFGNVTSTSHLIQYYFNRGTNKFDVVNALSVINTGVQDSGISWSPDGRFLVVGNNFNDGLDLKLYEVLSFPRDNVIKNNTVYCNSGAQFPSGIGISGSSIGNFMTGNIAYSNPINPSIVSTNYAFACNVYNQLFQTVPTLLQNIALGSCEQIAMPDDQALLGLQVQAQLGIINSRLESMMSPLAINPRCDATPVISATTITASGYYCLSATSVSSITIDADDVVLDLHEHTVTAGISVASMRERITIQNGTVQNSSNADAITVNQGVRDITIDSVLIQSARRGIFCNSVSRSVIKQCELVSNITGFEAQQSYNMVLDSVIARENRSSGFSFVQSSTNSVIACSALSTGFGNTAAVNNNVYGFISQNGFGNIFENCIANATQALSTSDDNSIVAGFALTGTEFCTKIIDCEAANAKTSASGVTVPYGIYLQPQFDGLISVTSVNPGNGIDDDVRALTWSSDGIYLAIGGFINGTSSDNLIIYEFDRTTQTLIEVTSASVGDFTYDQVNTLAWSPSGRYLAVGGVFTGTPGNNDFIVYSFDRTTQTLQLVASDLNGTVNTLAWSPDDAYLAVGGDITGNDLVLFSFNVVTQTITRVYSDSTLGPTVRTIAWSPDGLYVVVGGTFTGDDLRMYQFDRSSQTLILRDTDLAAADIRVAVWSPDGEYIVVGGSIAGDDLLIYTFNRTTNVLTSVASHANPTNVRSAMWSPNNQYIIVGDAASAEALQLYRFDRGANTLSLLASDNPGGGISDTVNAIAWSPDGQYAAAGGALYGSSSGNDLYIYRVLSFPSDNVIKNNTLYCNSGGRYPSGVGLSGSNICNMIIQNTAYSNPNNPTIVSSNYQFVCNVFNQQFQNAPTSMQNIALGSQEVIAAPQNTALLAKQIIYQMSLVVSDIDILAQAIVTSGCAATPITSATTINTAGSYCLAQRITGSITITASDVVLSLNNYVVTQGITIASGLSNITLENGIVENADSLDAISVGAGCAGITLDTVTVKNARRGIFFDGVASGLIRSCDMVRNITGLVLQSCSNIAVRDARARNNTIAGFSLVGTSTTTFDTCRALSTGFGNNAVRTNNVYGFVLQDSASNIFQNCIANATQALSTTDYTSIVAGFGLFGESNGNSILMCESSNAQTSARGVTIPYGIYAQGTLSSLLTLTAVPPLPVPSASVSRVQWSPDRRYVAVGLATGGSATSLYIYQFDTISNTLTSIASASVQATIADLDWSPDGKYLAVNIETAVTVYSFNTTNNELAIVANLVASNFNGTVVRWSNNGLWLALGFNASLAQLQTYKFDRSTGILTLTTSNDIDVGSGIAINAIDWSADDSYIATATNNNAKVRVFLFNQNATTLSEIAADSDIAVTNALDVRWSPDCSFIAIGTTGNDVRVYQFSSTSSVLALRATRSAGSSVQSIDWSGDGRMIIVGTAATPFLSVFSYDRGNSNSATALTQIAQAQTGTISAQVNSVDWSPDGQLIVTGAQSGAAQRLAVFNALTFSDKNIIQDTIVYCNSGGACLSGVGICVPSICNLVIQNTAYANPPNPFITSSNYQFVSNVFNQAYQNIPSIIQNISLGGCEPISTPLSELLLAQELLANVYSVGVCGPTALVQTTTLSSPGSYCLGNDVTGDFFITATCITLDLNDHCITGVVTVQTSYNVVIMNGTIKPDGTADTAAITLASTVQSAHLKNLSIKGTTSTAAVAGRAGISVAGNDVRITECTIIAGDGRSSTTGTAGGNGITLANDATRTLISNCVIMSGNGGSASAGAGGDGGHGIEVQDGASLARISDCIIFSTGSGGNATTSGGNGGHGIRITSGAVDTEVRNCIIRNTGVGGTGSPAGAGGKAILDSVVSGAHESTIFNNFAYDIVNSTKFDLQAAGEFGIPTPNPPTSTVINPFANVFA